MFMYQSSIFRFRQDLRIHDNHGLIQALSQSKNILPIFIFDSEILLRCPKYDKRLGFLLQVVKNLDLQLRAIGSQLFLFYGKPSLIIPQLIKKYHIQAIVANKSYGFGSSSRDKELQNRCKDNQISFQLCKDFLLVEPQELPERKVFTPFGKLRYKRLDVNPPQVLPAPKNISTLSISDYE